MMPKPGFKTSEFWLTLAVALIQSAFPILLLYEVITVKEAEVWEMALMTLLSAVAVGVPTATYSYGRSRVKRVYAVKEMMREKPKVRARELEADLIETLNTILWEVGL